MKKVIEHFKKYNKYSIYAAKSELKNEVANSYLNWMWWILDPIFFMLIYTFIVQVVFKTNETYFPIFVFIGLTVWNFFSRNVSLSVKIVSANKGIVTKVYIPKYILILQKIYVNLFKHIISFILIFIFMIAYRVPLAFSIVAIIPLTLVLFLITFGISAFLLHFGVYAEDLANVVNILLRLLFYLSGVFYSVSSRIPNPYNFIMIRINPIAYLIEESRNALLYGSFPEWSLMFYWSLISLIILYFSIAIVYKYENSYVKVI